MKRRVLFVCAVAISVPAAMALAETGTPVKVVGKRVNLRARPEMNAEVVGQVATGSMLMARSFQDGWVEVAAPESVDVWVHRDFVADNRVIADRLYVRGGPGISWQIVGQMVRGDSVVIRGEFGEWLKIAPPPSCTLWINRNFVEVLELQKPAPPSPEVAIRESQPSFAPRGSVSEMRELTHPAPPSRTRAEMVAAGAQPQTTVSVQEAPAPAPPDLSLIPLEGQGKRVQREGHLRLAGFVIGRPSRYRLVVQKGSRIQTVCYVRGNNSQLASFLGRRVLIRGREYWVRGIKDPVLVPEEIVPYAQ